MQEQGKSAGFDFGRDVIGEDLVVGGAAYDSTVWVADAEDGVRRRTETVDEPETLAEYEQRLAGDFHQRAEDIGTDFAKAAANLSAGPTLSDLLPRYEQLLGGPTTRDTTATASGRPSTPHPKPGSELRVGRSPVYGRALIKHERWPEE